MQTLATTAIAVVFIAAQVTAVRTTIARATDRTVRNPRATLGLGLATITEPLMSLQVGRIRLPAIAGVVADINREGICRSLFSKT